MDNKLKLINLAWPIAIEMFLYTLLGFADVFMLSKFSDDAAAGVAIVGQVIFLINIIFSVISTGTAVLISQNIGANNKEAIKKIIFLSYVINIIIGLFIGVLVFSFSSQILHALSVRGEMLEHARPYIKIVGGFAIIQGILNTSTAIIKSHGRTKITMFSTMFMNVINVIGDAIFIFGLLGFPILGTFGVAMATTISRFIASIILICYIFKFLYPLKDIINRNNLSLKYLKQLLKIGGPSAAENLLWNVSQIIVTKIILENLGVESQIARTYTISIISFVLIISIAIAQANQIIIGHLVGSRKFEKAYIVCLDNFKKSFFIACIEGVILFFTGKYLMGIFTEDPNVIHIGAMVLCVNAFLEPGRTFNLVIIGALKGAGDTIFPVIMGVFSMYLIGVGLGYTFGIGLGLGLAGIWIGLLLDEWIRGIIMYFRWKKKKWINKVMV